MYLTDTMARISYTEGYSDKSVMKQIHDLKKNKMDSLEAGEGLQIENGTISMTESYASDAELTAGLATKQDVGDYATRAQLAEGLAQKQNVGSYATTAELTAGLAQKQPVGDYATKNELTGVKASKQDKLVAGENITITGNVISATGSGGSTNVRIINRGSYYTIEV